MTPDEAKQIRKGDVLTIKPLVVVADGLDASGLIRTAGGVDGRWHGFIPEDILTRTPAPREIKVEEYVHHINYGSIRCEVLAINGKFAWIKHSAVGCPVVLLSDLRHADATEGHAP